MIVRLFHSKVEHREPGLMLEEAKGCEWGRFSLHTHICPLARAFHAANDKLSWCVAESEVSFKLVQIQS